MEFKNKLILTLKLYGTPLHIYKDENIFNIITKVWQFHNLQHLFQKCNYKIPQKRWKIKAVQDSNQQPTDFFPTIQSTELHGKK